MRSRNICQVLKCLGCLSCEETEFVEPKDLTTLPALWQSIKFYYTHLAWGWTILAILGLTFHTFDMIVGDVLYMATTDFASATYEAYSYQNYYGPLFGPYLLYLYLVCFVLGFLILGGCACVEKGRGVTCVDVLISLCLQTKIKFRASQLTPE